VDSGEEPYDCHVLSRTKLFTFEQNAPTKSRNMVAELLAQMTPNVLELGRGQDIARFGSTQCQDTIHDVEVVHQPAQWLQSNPHFVFGLSFPQPERTSFWSTARTSSLPTSTFTSSWLTTVEPCGTTTAPFSGTVIPRFASPVRLASSACISFMLSLVLPSALA